MGSLRDQLLKAKLVSKKDAKKAKREQRLQAKKQDSQASVSDNQDTQTTFEKERAEKAARSRQLEERNRKDQEEKLGIFRLRDIVLNSEVKFGLSGNRKFYFVNSKQRIPCLEVSPQAVDDLQNGQLAIVETPGDKTGEIRVISRRGAIKLTEEASHYVRFFNR